MGEWGTGLIPVPSSPSAQLPYSGAPANPCQQPCKVFPSIGIRLEGKAQKKMFVSTKHRCFKECKYIITHPDFNPQRKGHFCSPVLKHFLLLGDQGSLLACSGVMEKLQYASLLSRLQRVKEQSQVLNQVTAELATVPYLQDTSPQEAELVSAGVPSFQAFTGPESTTQK